MFYVLEVTTARGSHRVIYEEPLEKHQSNGSVTIKLVGTFQSVEAAMECFEEGKLGAGKRGRPG